MRTDFRFEDLSLEVTEDGYGTAEVSGVAQIDFSPSSAKWDITSLAIDVSRVLGSDPGRTLLERRVTPSQTFGALIERTLRTDPIWRGRIDMRVEEVLSAQEPRTPEFVRDYRRATQI